MTKGVVERKGEGHETVVYMMEEHSQCGYCGGNADWKEPAHISGGVRGMFDPASSISQKNGCGATFREVINAMAAWICVHGC